MSLQVNRQIYLRKLIVRLIHKLVRIHTILEAERTPSKKNLIAPSLDFLSPFFQPDNKNIGVDANSIPINIVSRSLDELTTKAPSRELRRR